MPRNNALNLSAGLLSVIVAVLLVMIKLWAFGSTGALSVAASLADSAMDLMVSLAGLAAITYAAKPADEDHAFGHSSAEDLAALGQSLFLLVSAVVIAVAAIGRLMAQTPPTLMQEGRGMIAMGLSVLLTGALVIWQRRVVRQTGSRVVRADSLHYVSDLIPNVGAILSLWVSARFGLGSVDSVVGLAAAALLGAGALRIGKGAWDALMDRRADPRMIADIHGLAKGWPGVHGVHDLKTRTAGSVVFVNIHIELDGEQSLRNAHAISAALRRAILKAHPNTDVMIHKDPLGDMPHPDDPTKKNTPP